MEVDSSVLKEFSTEEISRFLKLQLLLKQSEVKFNIVQKDDPNH